MKKLIAMCLTGIMLTACNQDKPAEQPATTSATPTKSTNTAPTASAYTKNPQWETIIVGTQGDYPPFSFKDEQGLLIGFDKEVLEAVATASEFNVEFIDAKRAEMTMQLDNNSTGIWASAITIKPERLAEMELSEPYLSYSRSAMILDNEANAQIKTIADLQGKTVSYSLVGGESEKKMAIDLNKDESALVPEDTAFLAIKAVYANKSVATLGNTRVFNYYALQYPDIKTRLIPTNNEVMDIGFAMKKGNTQLKDKVNAGLAKIKADGTYDKLVQKWFGELK